MNHSSRALLFSITILIFDIFNNASTGIILERGGQHNKMLAYLLLSSVAQGSIPSNGKKISVEKIFNVAEVNQHCWLEKSGFKMLIEPKISLGFSPGLVSVRFFVICFTFRSKKLQKIGKLKKQFQPKKCFLSFFAFYCLDLGVRAQLFS